MLFLTNLYTVSFLTDVLLNQEIEFMMEIFDYLTGRGGMLILGLFVVIVVLYNKIRTRNYFKRPSGKRKK
ncbi:hypothetical protein ATO12_01625 [Aquimarina atlantica]|uniref:Uncharacterized protein n=1 Tax=Aquimarina atlantica TaxID=1317122 RepID=A0A023BZI7_9FLAO|nr:hypothetical protein ATO12_01625 [Aquimarina atlantica]